MNRHDQLIVIGSSLAARMPRFWARAPALELLVENDNLGGVCFPSREKALDRIGVESIRLSKPNIYI
jgi:hypothetical protein